MGIVLSSIYTPEEDWDYLCFTLTEGSNKELCVTNDHPERSAVAEHALTGTIHKSRHVCPTSISDVYWRPDT